MELDDWAAAFAVRFGLPERYAVFDVETTGFHETDVITQFAGVLVDGERTPERIDLILDWTLPGWLGEGEVQRRLDNLRQKTEFDANGRPSGKHFPMTLEKMREQGVPPLRAVETIAELLSSCRVGGFRFVSHNGRHFDQRFLNVAFEALLPKEEVFRFAPGELYDTGTMVKASQLGEVPLAHEYLEAFSDRISSRRARGVRWSLGDYCVEHYGLRRDDDVGLLHDAAHDCELTRRLYEVFRCASLRTTRSAAANEAQS